MPVLVVVGQHDHLVCGPTGTDCSGAATIQQTEAPYYAPAAQLQVVDIADSGHDLNLHLTAHRWFDAAAIWSLTHIAP